MSTLSFIGLGTMGGPMVRNLCKAHHKVHIYDVNPAAVNALAKETGAEPMTSPAEYTSVDAVILMLPNSDIVHAVLGENTDPFKPARRAPNGHPGRRYELFQAGRNTRGGRAAGVGRPADGRCARVRRSITRSNR